MKTISEQSDVAVLTSDQPGKVVEDYEQPRFSRRDTLLTMFGVLMVMLLASLDQTIPLMAVLFFLLCKQRASGYRPSQDSSIVSRDETEMVR